MVKTEAARESALRSSLFKEQTVWLRQGPGRGNDRLTYGRDEARTQYKKRREQLVWAEPLSPTQPDMFWFSPVCATRMDMSTDEHMCEGVCELVCVYKLETDSGKIGKKEKGCESESSGQKFKPLELLEKFPFPTVSILISLSACMREWVCALVFISLRDHIASGLDKKNETSSLWDWGKASLFVSHIHTTKQHHGHFNRDKWNQWNKCSNACTCLKVLTLLCLNTFDAAALK